MKHGFVLMVVHHHPTDDTVDSGPNHLFCVCAELPLLGYNCTARRGRRVFKALRRGREIWDRGEGASEVTRGCGGTLLGDQFFRLLSLLCLVWIKS